MVGEVNDADHVVVGFDECQRGAHIQRGGDPCSDRLPEGGLVVSLAREPRLGVAAGWYGCGVKSQTNM